MSNDLWGEPIKARHMPAGSLGWYVYCFVCGRRVLAENAVPIAIHTDYCKRCYQNAITDRSIVERENGENNGE